MKPFNVKSRIIAALRQLSMYAPAITEAKRKARIDRGVYTCAFCQKDTWTKEIAVDHIKPIVPVTGWDSWDGYISRLFCDAKDLQVLCRPCHLNKSKAENEERKANTTPKPKKRTKKRKKK